MIQLTPAILQLKRNQTKSLLEDQVQCAYLFYEIIDFCIRDQRKIQPPALSPSLLQILMRHML